MPQIWYFADYTATLPLRRKIKKNNRAKKIYVMKKLALAIVAILTLGNAFAQTGQSGASNVRTIKSPRFVRPLIEKWLEEYSKTKPDVEIRLSQGAASTKGADLNVTLFTGHGPSAEAKHDVIYFGKTAILPITAEGSEASRLLRGKSLNSKKVKQLFFTDDEADEESRRSKAFEQITIYSGSNSTSLTFSFAKNFGEEASDIRGKRISGDDQFLNVAVSKDPLGVSFNAISNIFDLKNRQVKAGLEIVGLDLKRDIAAAFDGRATLDDILYALESNRPQEVAVETVGISFDADDEAVSDFVKWVLENGVRYNHEYGILNLGAKEANAQVAKTQDVLTAHK